MRANAGATGPYLIAYAVTLASFTVIWFNYPIYLYIGRDASLSLWLARTYGTWAYPFDVTAMNPFQGMTSMLMAGQSLFQSGNVDFSDRVAGGPEAGRLVHRLFRRSHGIHLRPGGDAGGSRVNSPSSARYGWRSCCFRRSTSSTDCKAGSRPVPSTATR
jgi:hypothetical protein